MLAKISKVQFNYEISENHTHSNVLAENEILKRSIQNHVKLKLAAHEYPRLIEFVHELPLTTTGKIIRKDLRENN